MNVALAEALRRCGVTSSQTLFALGAEQAWHLLQRAGVRCCIQSVLALEGAITGVPWHALPAGRRHELTRFAAARLG